MFAYMICEVFAPSVSAKLSVFYVQSYFPFTVKASPEGFRVQAATLSVVTSKSGSSSLSPPRI